jgi:hypothetical protein
VKAQLTLTATRVLKIHRVAAAGAFLIRLEVDIARFALEIDVALDRFSDAVDRDELGLLRGVVVRWLRLRSRSVLGVRRLRLWSRRVLAVISADVYDGYLEERAGSILARGARGALRALRARVAFAALRALRPCGSRVALTALRALGTRGALVALTALRALRTRGALVAFTALRALDALRALRTLDALTPLGAYRSLYTLRANRSLYTLRALRSLRACRGIFVFLVIVELLVDLLIYHRGDDRAELWAEHLVRTDLYTFVYQFFRQILEYAHTAPSLKVRVRNSN